MRNLISFFLILMLLITPSLSFGIVDFDLREVVRENQDIIFPAILAALVMAIINFALKRSQPKLAAPVSFFIGLFVFFYLLANPQFGEIKIYGGYSIYRVLEDFLPWIILLLMFIIIWYMRGRFNWITKIIVGVILLIVLPMFNDIFMLIFGHYSSWITFLLPVAIIVWGLFDLLSQVRERELR